MNEGVAGSPETCRASQSLDRLAYTCAGVGMAAGSSRSVVGSVMEADGTS